MTTIGDEQKTCQLCGSRDDWLVTCKTCPKLVCDYCTRNTSELGMCKMCDSNGEWEKKEVMFDINRMTAKDLTEDGIQHIDELFEYQPATTNQVDRMMQVRLILAEAVKVIIRNVPPCADRSVALRKIREARMDANQAIVHSGKTL